MWLAVVWGSGWAEPEVAIDLGRIWRTHAFLLRPDFSFHDSTQDLCGRAGG